MQFFELLPPGAVVAEVSPSPGYKAATGVTTQVLSTTLLLLGNKLQVLIFTERGEVAGGINV